MRAAVALVALSAALSSASAGLVSRQSLPSCANPCITNANLGGCSATDDTCLCESQTFINSTTTCIESSCTGNDLQEAEQYAQSLCLAVGVTLTIATPTPTSTSPTSSSSSTATATQTGSATSSYGINGFAAAAAILGVGLAL
ncbi:hypothetical protein EDD16DRAFT_1594859 [Pisolithus croceorrhizus]|nr:hypothetical protein EDD16DRAFT_1594859 [Pisolithus croceorrhizus]